MGYKFAPIPKAPVKPIITLPILFLKKCYVFLLYFFLNKVNTFSQNRLLFQRNCCRIINKLQRCLSGLRSTIGNRVTGILVRRFESSSLRHRKTPQYIVVFFWFQII